MTSAPRQRGEEGGEGEGEGRGEKEIGKKRKRQKRERESGRKRRPNDGIGRTGKDGGGGAQYIFTYGSSYSWGRS